MPIIKYYLIYNIIHIINQNSKLFFSCNGIVTGLKKYSDVDIRFIKEFLDIRQGDKTHDPFRIDLDIISEWLKTSKDKLKKTLTNSYVENIDYILLIIPKGSK